MYEAWEKLAAWCAALASAGIGVVLLAGPGEVARDLPEHEMYGGGALAFGVLFALALACGGRRLKGLLVAVAGAAVAALIGASVGPPVTAAWQLAQAGRPAPARVVGLESTKLRGQKFVYLYRIEYADRERVVSSPVRLPERIQVVYLPDDPDVVAVGGTGSFVELVRRQPGLGTAVGGGVVALLAAFGAFAGLARLLRGAR